MMVEEQETGFPCPYREPATLDDQVLLQLATMAVHTDLGHLWRACFDVTFETRTPHERRHRMSMIMRAITDDRIIKRIRDARAAAAAEAKTKGN